MSPEQIREARALCERAGRAIRFSHDFGYPHVRYTPVTAEDIERALTDALDAIEERDAEIARLRADAQSWRTLVRLAAENPYVSVSHGDGSDSASGFKGWDGDVVTGIPLGAVVEDGYESADALVRVLAEQAHEVRRAHQWPDPGEQAVS